MPDSVSGAGAGLDQRAAGAAVDTAIGDDPADRGRQAIAADGEFVRAERERARAFERAGDRAGGCQARKVDTAAPSIGDQPRVAAAAGYRQNEVVPPLLVMNVEAAGRAGAVEKKATIIGVRDGSASGRAGGVRPEYFVVGDRGVSGWCWC